MKECKVKRKKCTTCNIMKDNTSDNFWSRSKPKVNGDPYHSQCKICKDDKRRERLGGTQRRFIDWSRDTRRCTGCDQFKLHSQFRDVAVGSKAARGKCKACESEYQSKMYAEKIGRVRVPGMRKVLFEMTLPGERPMSMNKLTGAHWAKYKKDVDRVKMVVRENFSQDVVDGDGWPLTDKVDIWIHVYYSTKPQDSGNPVTKGHEDALIGRVITEDDMDYVGYVASKAFIDRENPRVEIIITKEFR